MSKSHRLAWAAGFFDGEGYVNIQRRSTNKNGKHYSGYYLRIGINHVAIAPLFEMQSLFGGTIEKQSAESVVGNRKQRHRWVTSTQNAANALIQLLPYLKNKNEVVEKALEFQETMQREGKTIRVPEEITNLRQNLKVQITALNARD